jgi:acyl-CoA synthetase (AMP-forming)/AMP-acid ligase II
MDRLTRRGIRLGDLVALMEDGSIRFSDRAKDMLKAGARNVAVLEIERWCWRVPSLRERWSASRTGCRTRCRMR